MQACPEALAAFAMDQCNASYHLIDHGIVAALYRTGLRVDSTTKRVLTLVMKTQARLAEAEDGRSSAEAQAAALREQCKQSIATIQAEAQSAAAKAKMEADAEIGAAHAEGAVAAAKARKEAESAIAEVRASADAAMARGNQEADSSAALMRYHPNVCLETGFSC